MTNDAKLIGKTLNGDVEAFGLLVRKYQSPTYAVAFRRIGRWDIAEEITQDAFVTAYQKLSQLKDRNRFGAWLRSITFRLCGMWLRSKIRNSSTHPLPAHLSGANPVGKTREATLGVDSLIKRLPQRLKAAAVLCFEDELSPSAAAGVLGIRPGTLRKRLHDARAQLQRKVVEKAEQELRMHLLPKNFAEKCVCRCKKSERARTRKEVRTMAKKKNCGCGCLGKSRSSGKTTPKKAK